MPPFVEVHNLEKRYPLEHGLQVYAVNGVSFSINQGKTLGLVGESGSGKSTVGYCLLRLVEASSGRVVVDGADILSLPGREMRAWRRRMQMVFQDPADSLNPRMEVGAIVEEPLLIQGVPKVERKERVRRLFAQVHLGPELLERYPGHLSGGQQQRVGVARAIATNPDFVVLDEPTSSLDVSVRGEILALLDKLQRDLGLTYLLISHDLSAVRTVSDRIAVMYLGHIVEVGPTEEVFNNPQHPYTKALLSSILVPELYANRQRYTLSGEIPNPTNLPPGCPLSPRCPVAVSACFSTNPTLELLGEDRLVACLVATGRVNEDGSLKPSQEQGRRREPRPQPGLGS